MRVEVLVPDVAMPRASTSDARGFAGLVDAAAAVLEGAERAERAFADHRGGLQEMVVARARADVALQIAATAAQRAAQGLQTVLGMQV